MDALEQARRYIAAIPGAISGSGGHNQTYTVACHLVHGFALPQSDAWALLQEYNRTCSPAWSEAELRHKLQSAEAATSHEKPRGHLLSKRSVRHKLRAAVEPKPSPAPPAPPAAKSKSRSYDISASVELPKPIPDGTRALLKAAFEPGDGICICQARTDEDGKEAPKDGGTVLSREEWLRKLDGSNGDPNKFMRTSDKNGIYIAINPLKTTGGRTNNNVTSFRHALVEFDKISIEEQWLLIKQSNIPCTAVVSSGSRSLHAWVRVDAIDRREYDERIKILYTHFEQQYRPDEKNKDPARLSRLANCMRGNKRQELLALGIGAESFSSWEASLEADSIGKTISVDELLSFDPANDQDCIIGERYLCKGGSMMFVGQSGIGKSSLAVQAAASWAVGRSVFGIAPRHPLKSVFVQAENDDGDLAEMLQGVVNALSLTPDERARLNSNLIFVSDASHVGDSFVAAAHRLIDLHRPDLFWGDPVLSFIGDDASKQSVCSRFFRQGFGPVLKSTGVATIWVHHVGKPPADPKSRKKWTATDYSYVGTGSSDMTNAMRAVCVLLRVTDDTFELKFAKRGKRAGATSIDGSPTLSVWLRHADRGIHWEQVAEPVKESKYSANKSEDGKPSFDVNAFMAKHSRAACTWGKWIEHIEEFAGITAKSPSTTGKRLWCDHVKPLMTKDGDMWKASLE